ncbi:MAG: FlgK family flagellar hook-associated protein [Gemmobacter sp.]
MSLSTTLNAALSGLGAAARGAEVVASNIANARTPGYARRELQLTGIVLDGKGQGVRGSGTARIVDLALANDRRAAGALSAGASVRSGFLAGLERVIGLPGDPGSLGDRIGRLEGAILAAAGRPEAEARLAGIAAEARALAGGLSQASAHVQQERERADRAIAADVDFLNRTLAQIADLNGRIRQVAGSGRDAAGLVDLRAQLIDGIAEIVPLRELPREHGQVALYTAGGAALLDGGPAVFGFEAAGTIVPQMTQASGALSGLTLNGRPLATGGVGTLIAGGRLAAAFAVRDELAPAAQARLDALARDLLERFADPATDPSLGPGAPGLFADLGGPSGPGAEIGLAGRLRLNPLADPDAGGELWRIRAGLGAAGPGDSGSAAQLDRLAAALDAPRVPASGGFGPGARSFSSLAADLASGLVAARLSEEDAATHLFARLATLREIEAAGGVDTDVELQRLLQIERAYAANARVIQAVDRMLENLMGL